MLCVTGQLVRRRCRQKGIPGALRDGKLRLFDHVAFEAWLAEKVTDAESSEVVLTPDETLRGPDGFGIRSATRTITLGGWERSEISEMISGPETPYGLLEANMGITMGRKTYIPLTS